MIALAGVLLLLAAFYAFAFGATRLLLRGTALAEYAFEAPWLNGPALLILALSLLGYREPYTLPAWQPWLAFAAGCALSLVVAWWDRQALAGLFRQHSRRFTLTAGPALLALVVLFVYFGADVWTSVRVPLVAEYTNYSELACVLTGQHQGEPDTLPCPFATLHHTLRWGQDLVVASTALMTDRHPIQVILPLALLCRFQFAIALGLIVAAMAPDRTALGRIRLILLLDAFLVIEVLIFGSSFFSSNLTTPLFTIYLVWLAGLRGFGWRELPMLVLANLFFLLTYPEFLVVTKAFEGLAIVRAWRQGQRETWRPLLLGNVAVLALHPLRLLALSHNLTGHMGTGYGWNVLGHPLEQPDLFVGNLLGARLGLTPGDPLKQPAFLIWLLAALVASVVLPGLFLLAKRYRAWLPVGACLAVVLVAHVVGVQRHGNFYNGYKVLSHSYFVAVLAAAALLFHGSHNWQRFARVAIGVWLIVSIGCCAFWLVRTQRLGHMIEYAALRELLGDHLDGRPVAVACPQREVFFLANLVSGEGKATLVAITEDQREWGHKRALGRNLVICQANSSAVVHDGPILIHKSALKDGQAIVNGEAFTFQCRRTLGTAGQLVLCEGQLSLPRAVTMPENWWVERSNNIGPAMAVLSRRLVVEGRVYSVHPLPYRFTCHVPELGWSQSFVVEKTGDFAVHVDLPPSALRQVLSLRFSDFDTFRPSLAIPGSRDSRDLGFMLLGLRFEDER